MRTLYLLYAAQSGELLGAYTDAEWPAVDLSGVNVSTDLYELDAVLPDNRAMIVDLRRSIGRFNGAGEQRFYIDTSTGALTERSPWQEAASG